MKTIASIAFIGACLSGCINPPKVMQTKLMGPTLIESSKDHLTQIPVRWSGVILQTLNNADHSCFEILETQTANTGRPTKTAHQEQYRFIACKNEQLKPFDYQNRLVTISGEVVTWTDDNIGTYPHHYPIVSTNDIHIWHDKPVYTRHTLNNIRGNEKRELGEGFMRFACQNTFVPGTCLPMNW